MLKHQVNLAGALKDQTLRENKLERRQQSRFGLQSQLALSSSNYSIVSHVFSWRTSSPILFALLWGQDSLQHCRHHHQLFTAICVLQHHFRGLRSTMLNKQSQSYHLNLHISHPQKAEFTLQTLPCVYEMNTWLQQNPARSLSAFQSYCSLHSTYYS